MSWWPWSKSPPPEKRQSQPFTDAIVNAIAAQAGGNVSGDPLATSAVEMAAGAYQRAFQGCTVKTDNTAVKKALTPAILGNIARSLIRRGESIYMIDVQGGMVQLVPIGSWDVQGGYERESWFYRLDAFAPTGNRTFFLPSASVVHCMYSYDPARPWLGLSPLQWGSLTGNLLANIEARLVQESGAPSGYFLPLPEAPKDDDVDEETTTPGPLVALKKDIAAAKGGTVVVGTTAGGYGDKQSSPRKDMEVSRFGFNAPEVMQVLRSEVGVAVLGACGVPPDLFVGGSNSQAQREAWRRFILGSAESVAKLVEAELSAKLSSEITLDFSSTFAHDVQGRATSLAKMVSSGMPLQQALGLSGLLIQEEE